jgi:hypothetical protein
MVYFDEISLAQSDKNIEFPISAMWGFLSYNPSPSGL